MWNTQYKVLPFHAMKVHGEVEVWLHFNLGPNASGQLHAPATSIAGKEPPVSNEQEAVLS